MKVKEIQIKNFGKLHNINIHPLPGINVIYGENEAGKSTLQRFIAGILFGLEPDEQKDGKKSAYQQYEPWSQDPSYGGGLKFSIDDTEYFLERDFRKDGKSFHLSGDGQTIEASQASLEKLLGGIQKEAYENTYCIRQAAVETKREFAKILQDYFMDAPLDEDYIAARQRLQRGEQEAHQLYQERLGKRKAEERRILMQRELLEKELQQLEKQKAETSEIFQNRQADLPVQEEEANEMAEYLKESRQKKQKLGYHMKALLSLLVAVLGIFALYWIGIAHSRGGLMPMAWMLLEVVWILVTVLGICGAFFWQGKSEKVKKAIRQQEAEKEQFLRRAMEREKHKFQEENERQARQAAMEEMLQGQIFDKHAMLVNLQEELEDCKNPTEDEKEADYQVKAYQLAGQVLEEISKDAHEDARRRLEQEISKIFAGLTRGKYRKIGLDDQMNLVAWEGDRWVNPWQLSRGTMEQMYVALRMGAGRVLTREESMPILLDEVFASFDERRLEAALEWLGRQEGQIFLFTCQEREIELLNKKRIPYGKIVLESET